MKYVFLVAIICAPLIISAYTAFYMVSHNISGWGWFLGVSALAGFISVKNA